MIDRQKLIAEINKDEVVAKALFKGNATSEVVELIYSTVKNTIDDAEDVDNMKHGYKKEVYVKAGYGGYINHVCSNCDEDVSMYDAYCRTCGAKLDEEVIA